MFEKFYPKRIIDSVYTFDFQELYDEGYRGVIFDIDNTLVEDMAPADDRVVKLINELKEIGFSICIVSNNNIKRVGPFANKIDTYFVCKALKPSKKGFLIAVEKLNVGKDKVVFIGDQLLTDIRGANAASIYSILVKPINLKTERLRIRIKRIFERFVLVFYRKQLKNK